MVQALVKIDDNTTITSHVSIGSGVSIGKDCYIYPSVVIRENCILHNNVIIQPGAVIGSCGFGYIPNATGDFIKLQQVGNVILEDNVEIGANTAIDRARFKSTIISKGTKIDNLVQIAHNVVIGQNNAIAAQSGIAGSSKTGNNIMMGGQVGITGHVEITNSVLLATRSGVSKSITKPGTYRGSPVMPLHEYQKNKVHLRKISKYVAEIKHLKERLLKLESLLDKQ